jgi:uncharacterized protein (DUF2126 family)/transglutaminase-like putative cysteine protease
MSIRVALHHKTHYQYKKPISIFPQVVRLRPAPHARTPIHAYSLKIQPGDHFINWMQDPFGNYQARLVFPEKADKFTVEVDLVAEMTVINPFDFFLEEYADEYPFKYTEELKSELLPYLQIKEDGNLLKSLISKLDLTKRRTVDFLVYINQIVHSEVGYIIRMEPGVQTSEETLILKKGSCRDSAWLLVQMLRHIGLAARFTSGYLIQLVPDVKAIDGPSGTTVDFTDLHAWTEVYLPGAGWVGLDPTSGLFAGEGHIPLACTPNPSSAAPIAGGIEKGAEAELQFEMSVTRIEEEQRVTKPYTEEVWNKIYALGQKVDKDLKDNDVRLTMGGEPTFVSVSDMDGAEWNTDALGPTKKNYAIELFNKLKDKFASGPLLHYGQGKWYPGESLPRWALSCYWRKDGKAIWNDPNLIADERVKGKYTSEDAERFIRRLTTHLAVTDEHVAPGFEDVYYYLWKEGTLPVNVDPFKRNLKDTEERKTLRRVLEAGLGTTAGFVLPIKWDWLSRVWRSGKWHIKRDRLYLLPGDSPMGFRLPLSSLPHSESYFYEEEPSSFARPAQLENFYDKVTKRHQAYVKNEKKSEGINSELDALYKKYAENRNLNLKEDSWEMVRTALCVEPRNGNLHIFLPPTYHAEEYLDLVSSVELTASELGIPVLIEGYLPPYDVRLQRFQITPDPGVIEVNVHPTEDWETLVKNTEILYEEAHLTRLGTEKFMLDGRHTGTGGGNHITLGGVTPSDSPLLRKPDLLRSLLSYWNNHPSLSYLFSGLFVGPTSQAPRMDEARHESLNELEIAFKELDRNTFTPLWLVDRLFRNLLTDLTGNTHRAEFCIDKLYSPDSSTGRLGILEMRAFEMPPHTRMSLAQMLLIRSLVSKFWNEPYKRPLLRHGTILHDKYLLPHFIWEDFKEVILDLNDTGYEFDPNWYKVFLDFRFPIFGTVQSGDIKLEIRMAIEPWLVLGEEGIQGGTARYVDSSLERVQVRVFGMTGKRHIITCNGRPVPIQPTGVNGEFVGGVRYRAWQPPSALHPTIPIHAPIVFDVVDTWNNRAVGGCTYFVAHPGGRGYTTFPVNSNEAESRRFTRFTPFGHTPNTLNILSEELNPEFPYTLDLRK